MAVGPGITDPDADGVVGSCTDYPCDVLPGLKYMWADGTAVSRSTYSLLFSRMGTRHGVGDGSTTFNLPNRVGKFAVGLDPADVDWDVVGEKGGTKVPTMPSHVHTNGTLAVSPSSHSHTQGADALVASPGAGGGILVNGGASSTGSTALSITGSLDAASSGSATNGNSPPYDTTRYIVKVL